MPTPITAMLEKAAQEAAAKVGVTPKVESATTEEPEIETEATEPEDEQVEEVVEEVGGDGEQEGEPEGEPESEPEESQTVPLERFNEVYGRYKQLERGMEQLLQERDERLRQETERKVEQIEPPDFENMTEKEKAKWLLDSVSKLVDGKLDKRLTPLQTQRDQERADIQVREVAAKYKDFKLLAPHMIEVAKQNPTLSAEDVYFLTKARVGGTKGFEKERVAEIAKKVQSKIALKKKATTTKRSSPTAKLSENNEFKTVKDAAESVARKLGLIKE